MMPAQLKETTMDPAKRTMLRVVLLADDREGADSVERLMGTKAEARFAFISDKGIRQQGTCWTCEGARRLATVFGYTPVQNT